MKKTLSLALALALLMAAFPLLPAPVAIAAEGVDTQRIVALATGYSETFVIKEDGTLWAWGDNDNGQLGDGTYGRTTAKYTPVQVGTDTDWVSVASGMGHTLALKTDGSLWAWGSNHFGELGDGTNLRKTVPVQIGTATDWVSISAGGSFSAAIKSDGSLWTWGDNRMGELGIGTVAILEKNTPTRVGTATNWASVSTGSSHMIALKTDGSLWVWGMNNFGALGDGGAPLSRISPYRLGTDTDWKSISAGTRYTIALKADGSLWGWGENRCGQLGDGSTIQRNAPVRIGTASDWASASAGLEHTLALKTDGSLWAWGSNEEGCLGDGTATDKRTPVKIGTVTDWIGVSASGFHSVALMENGSLWAWGRGTLLGIGITDLRDDKHTPGYIMGPPIPLNGVTLDKTTAEVPTDYFTALTPIFEPYYATNKAVTWQSSDETIATVNEKGRVTGVALGTAIITATTEDGGFTASCEVTVVKNTHGIDYDGVEDVIIPGSINGFSINLTKETLTIPDSYMPVLYSIDGGAKWKPVKDALSEAKFPKLLNKDITFQLSDKPIDKTTKKPTEGAVVVSFAKINKRATAPKLVVNYAIGADVTGLTTGDWLLTEKNGTKAVKEGIQVGVADSGNKKLDEKGYGQFHGGLANGIPVKALTGDKVSKTAYFIRTAPKKDGVTYTAASKPIKITVSGEQKAPKYKIKTVAEKKNRDGSVKTQASATLKLKKGDLIFAGAVDDIGAVPTTANSPAAALSNEGVLRITGDKGSTVSVMDVTGAMLVWKEATAKKPASAKQTVGR